MEQRKVWREVIERLDETLKTYELRIKRNLVDVALGGAHGTEKAYAYRVELTHAGVTASAAGLDQPEIVLPQLCSRLLANENVLPVGPRLMTDGKDAFRAALDAARLERGIVDNAPARPGQGEE